MLAGLRHQSAPTSMETGALSTGTGGSGTETASVTSSDEAETGAGLTSTLGETEGAEPQARLQFLALWPG